MKRFPIFTGRILLLLLPIALLIPVAPVVGSRVISWWEPLYFMPLERGTPLEIRSDPYGKGHFGARRSGGRKHRGADLIAPMGTTVLAAKSGWAVVGKRKDGMGQHVLVKHPDGFTTRYGHLSRIDIRDGQWVWRGTPIGEVGKSGNAKHRMIKAHLHFEVLDPEGQAIDPLRVLHVVSRE